MTQGEKFNTIKIDLDKKCLTFGFLSKKNLIKIYKMNF